MPVNLPPLPELQPVSGIRLGTTTANLRKKDRRDLVVIECAPGTQVAAVFTRNRFCAAPVTVAREHLSMRAPRALIINTGFANAGTGVQGLEDAKRGVTKLRGRMSPEHIAAARQLAQDFKPGAVPAAEGDGSGVDIA